MTDTTGEIKPSLAWLGVCALAKKDGIKDLRNHGDGVYRTTFGLWTALLNGSDKPVAPEGGKQTLPPFDIYVTFNGWPAGVIGPDGGILAAGDAANEDTFIAAIEAELGKPIMDALS